MGGVCCRPGGSPRTTDAYETPRETFTLLCVVRCVFACVQRGHEREPTTCGPSQWRQVGAPSDLSGHSDTPSWSARPHVRHFFSSWHCRSVCWLYEKQREQKMGFGLLVRCGGEHLNRCGGIMLDVRPLDRSWVASSGVATSRRRRGAGVAQVVSMLIPYPEDPGSNPTDGGKEKKKSPPRLPSVPAPASLAQ